MLRERVELEENLINSLEKIKTKRKIVNEIKKELAQYEILHGDTQGYIGNAKKEVPALNPRVLYLLTDAVHRLAHQELGIEATKIIPTDYFTKQEIRTAKQYTGELEREDKITLPITLSNVLYLGKGVYMTKLSAKLIKDLMDSMLLHYNYSTQREATVKKVKDQIVYQPTINKNNILEMVEHLKNDTLYPDKLVINAGIKSSELGYELEYNDKKAELLITKGTKLDIIDGYHRCKAIQNALAINPNIDMNFPVLITNLNERAAQRFLGQMSKAMPISKVRSDELTGSRLADDVMQQLKEESELKGRIAQTETVHRRTNELVSYGIMADTIDKVFKIKNKAEAMDVGDYLVEFFSYLLGSFSEQFIENVQETRKRSIINHNNIIGIGYVVLAKRMMDKGIKYRKVKDIINSIDFSRDNPMWQKLNILDEKGTFVDVNKSRKNIKEYFDKLNIEEIVEEKV